MPEPDYRFTLANERTFLAYERTALGLVAAGLAVGYLSDGNTWSHVLSVLLCVGGAVVAVIGVARFRAVESAIREGRPLPTSRAVLPIAAVVATGAVVGLVASLLR